MKRRLWYLIIATLQIITWYSVSHEAVPQTVHIPHFPHSVAAADDDDGKTQIRNEQTYRGLSRLGSRPPICVRKCGGCLPCNAIQIPATTDRKTVQYANYEPEGWKCKCGTAFFNP
ncbi:EPIDERMAL PATTERNING FACTOR-like protein 3 [Mercurialis annua]|uniref:EPIDERMAL PATTERNING FACTOR-like protein 3 n=1 Tax=Mercurialis annua TaxID=3986 RepID=UPI00215E92F5|nr:EPIDERMAL PATTERNING FACTOR-like protein 3 [Mercurialis annua]XP_050216662.1 EPIDERMAL PATTERNING FACTOR-like protein 3 [Mercurialis annua]